MYEVLRGLKITDMVKEPARLSVSSKQLQTDDHPDRYIELVIDLQNVEGKSTMFIIPITDSVSPERIEAAVANGAEIIDIFMFKNTALNWETNVYGCGYSIDTCSEDKLILEMFKMFFDTCSEYSFYHNYTSWMPSLEEYRTAGSNVIFANKQDADIFQDFLNLWYSTNNKEDVREDLERLLENRSKKFQLTPYRSELMDDEDYRNFMLWQDLCTEFYDKFGQYVGKDDTLSFRRIEKSGIPYMLIDEGEERVALKLSKGYLALDFILKSAIVSAKDMSVFNENELKKEKDYHKNKIVELLDFWEAPAL